MDDHVSVMATACVVPPMHVIVPGVSTDVQVARRKCAEQV